MGGASSEPRRALRPSDNRVFRIQSTGLLGEVNPHHQVVTGSMVHIHLRFGGGCQGGGIYIYIFTGILRMWAHGPMTKGIHEIHRNPRNPRNPQHRHHHHHRRPSPSPSSPLPSSPSPSSSSSVVCRRPHGLTLMPPTPVLTPCSHEGRRIPYGSCRRPLGYAHAADPRKMPPTPMAPDGHSYGKVPDNVLGILMGEVYSLS